MTLEYNFNTHKGEQTESMLIHTTFEPNFFIFSFLKKKNALHCSLMFSWTDKCEVRCEHLGSFGWHIFDSAANAYLTMCLYSVIFSALGHRQFFRALKIGSIPKEISLQNHLHNTPLTLCCLPDRMSSLMSSIRLDRTPNLF